LRTRGEEISSGILKKRCVAYLCRERRVSSRKGDAAFCGPKKGSLKRGLEGCASEGRLRALMGFGGEGEEPFAQNLRFIISGGREPDLKNESGNVKRALIGGMALFWFMKTVVLYHQAMKGTFLSPHILSSEESLPKLLDVWGGK